MIEGAVPECREQFLVRLFMSNILKLPGNKILLLFLYAVVLIL